MDEGTSRFQNNAHGSNECLDAVRDNCNVAYQQSLKECSVFRILPKLASDGLEYSLESHLHGGQLLIQNLGGSIIQAGDQGRNQIVNLLQIVKHRVEFDRFLRVSDDITTNTKYCYSILAVVVMRRIVNKAVRCGDESSAVVCVYSMR